MTQQSATPPNAGLPWLRVGEETQRVFMVSLTLSLVLWIVLVFLRAHAGHPYGERIFRHLLLYQDFYFLLPFAAVLVAALFARVRSFGLQAAAWCGRHPAAVALLTTGVLAAGTHAVYHAHPLAMDEYAPVFQSRIFASGALSARLPPELLDWLIPKGFQQTFFGVVPDSGVVVSSYWPGFALLLTPFAALGTPWLLNPLIGGATVLVMHRLAQALFDDEESAGLAVLLTVASPAVTINAISYYSMPAHLLANAVFMLLLLRRTAACAALAGLVGSAALVLHNPVPHVLFALPWILWLAAQPARWRLLAALAAGYLPLCLLLGFGWQVFLQSLASPSDVSELATPGSAARRLTQSFGAFSAPSAALLEARLLGLAKIWLWAVPGLLVVAAIGAWRKRDDRGPWLALAGSALLTYFGYFLVRFDQGHGWGYRYFHGAWLALPLFALAALGRAREASPARGELRGFLAGCALLGVLLTGLYALHVERFIARHLAQMPSAAAGARVLIVDASHGYYRVDLVQNDPLLRNPPLVFVSLGREADAAMMAARFPAYRLLALDRRGSVWGPR